MANGSPPVISSSDLNNQNQRTNMKGPLLVVFIVVIILLAIWDGIWKLIALWKSARNNQLAWFICVAIFNTVGILPILYILLFQKAEAPVPAPPPKI
jgi:predicted permease